MSDGVSWFINLVRPFTWSGSCVTIEISSISLEKRALRALWNSHFIISEEIVSIFLVNLRQSYLWNIWTICCCLSSGNSWTLTTSSRNRFFRNWLFSWARSWCSIAFRFHIWAWFLWPSCSYCSLCSFRLYRNRFQIYIFSETRVYIVEICHIILKLNFFSFWNCFFQTFGISWYFLRFMFHKVFGLHWTLTIRIILGNFFTTRVDICRIQWVSNTVCSNKALTSTCLASYNISNITWILRPFSHVASLNTSNGSCTALSALNIQSV